MNGMKHSKTIGMKRKENHTSYPRQGGARASMDKSHRNYAKDRREGGPFGK